MTTPVVLIPGDGIGPEVTAAMRQVVEAAGAREDMTVVARDHAAAVRLCLEQLADPKRACLRDPGELVAIGFKAVHAKGISGVQRVDDRVLDGFELRRRGAGMR